MLLFRESPGIYKSISGSEGRCHLWQKRFLKNTRSIVELVRDDTNNLIYLVKVLGIGTSCIRAYVECVAEDDDLIESFWRFFDIARD